MFLIVSEEGFKSAACFAILQLPPARPMKTPDLTSAVAGSTKPGSTPEIVSNEWCQVHVLIEELTRVQKRVGTPLEEPEDFGLIRGIGSNIREKLDHLSVFAGERK
jgi:hypothetical protein